MATLKNVKIEKGIPIPSQGKNSELFLTISSMKVGDSIHLDGYTSTRFSYIRKNIDPKIKITTRTTETGIRFWRIK